MSLSALVATLLDNLAEISPSTDRRGKSNWQKFGSPDHCWRCGGGFGKEIEPGSQVVHHIIPTSEGGSDTADNRASLCSNCHSVVHRFYLPTGLIGAKRTRDGTSRVVGEFSGLRISQILPSEDHALGMCEKCGIRGTVTGVTEGYWNGEGVAVFLDCSGCGLKFAIPFIGTLEAPAFDPFSVLNSAITSGMAAAPNTLPPELKAQVDGLMHEMQEIIRATRREMNATATNARRSGASERATKRRMNEIRKNYIEKMQKLLPGARSLTEECEPYRPS
jgi:HNH endonuclease